MFYALAHLKKCSDLATFHFYDGVKNRWVGISLVMGTLKES